MVDLSFRQLELFAQGMKGPVRRDRTTHQLVEGLSQHHG
jgi:hypothetical protein